MEIKINARLSAYSRVDEIHGCNIETIPNEEIDRLFEDLDEPISVTKDEIDTLFTDTNSDKISIDIKASESGDVLETVSKTAIDSLFI